MPSKPSNRLRFNIPTLEETFKGERAAWRNARKERQRKEASNRKRGTGNRLDGLCHIDGKPCPRAAKCAFRCFEVCQNLAETTSSSVYCSHTSSCSRKHQRPRFTCGLREANITE